MIGILFHTLKGKPGWGRLALEEIDVCKIQNMTYFKRLFCIFDRDHPYTLSIVYNQPFETIQLINGINSNGGVTTTLVNKVVLTQQITRRYQTEESARKEIEDIQQKIRKMNDYKKKLMATIME